jgi:hypothetical protein
MAIEGIGWPTIPSLGSPGVARSAGGFTVPARAQAGRTDGTSPAVPASLGSVLTLQELGAEAVEDREARRRGRDMLALLAALQRGLLGGVDNIAALQQLAELAASVPRPADRRLAAMISAIVVRVRVELARRQA